MPLDIVTIDDPRWPELVRQADADIFYEPFYCRYMSSGTALRPVLLLYHDALGSVFDVTLEKKVEVLPFYADVAERFSRSPVDLASPEYNSPVVIGEPSTSAELLSRYRAAVDCYCQDSGVVTEFTRFHPFSESGNGSSALADSIAGAEMVYVDLRDGYEAASRGYRKGHRSTVRKAEREGASFRFRSTSDSTAVDKLFELYSATMSRKDAKSVYFHDREFFTTLFENLGDRAVLMESLARGEVASSNLFLLGRKHVWFKYSGLEQRHRQSGAHTYMMDRAIHWAAEQGYEYLMLGAGMLAGDSTHSFKRGFSHLSTPIRHMRRVHAPDSLAILTGAKAAYNTKLGREIKSDYFPSYWLD